MEEQWILINYQELLKSILNGNRSIQEPISITNMKRDKSKQLSFLNMLLSYQNIDKNNILEVLTNIYKDFIQTIENLQQNKTINTMMNRINNEWYDPDYIFTIKNPIPRDFFDVNLKNKEYYNTSCKKCKNVHELSKLETNIPLDLKEGDTHPLEKYIDQSIQSCNESLQYIQKNCKGLESFIDSLKNVTMTQFIDLSIKHKSLYLTLSEEHEDDQIPENIHHVFSNYIHIHNLLLKQLIQYYHYLILLVDTIQGECNKMKDMKQNITAIAYTYEKNEDNNDEMLDYEEHQSQEMDQNDEQEKGGDILKKITSFF